MSKAGLRIVVGTTLALMAAGTSALAQSCSGVEGRVNARTSALQTALTSHITARTSALVAQETLQRSQLLSALRVFTRQLSLSSEQEANATDAAQMALANVIVEDSVSRQLHEAVTDYGNTGHAACELVEAGATVATALENYTATRAAMVAAVMDRRVPADEGEFRDMMAEWSNLVREADDATIQAVLEGDAAAAEAFIAVVAGPPRFPVEAGSGSVLSQMDRVDALSDEARNSAAVFALSDLASTQGLRVALEEMSDIWVGDGGEEWAARMAASSERAVLLDTARIEAHNIAMSALELKQGVTQELALSVFALTYIDNLRKAQAAEE
ncbi:MAG: hypothetical protein HC844_07130 [Tabrizicola sp.]|nr:hypothetical protein [Tabrizicola sp.]